MLFSPLTRPGRSNGELRHCVAPLLRPAVRLCLRNGVHFQDLIEILKAEFVQAAEIEIGQDKQRTNISRISAATGLQRKDISRILESSGIQAKNLLARVLGQWQLDENFLDTRGKPRKLVYGGEKCEVSELVKKVSSDLNPGTILLELERLAAVRISGNIVELKTSVLKLGKDAKQALAVAAEEADTLLKTVEQNLFQAPPIANLHATTEFNNIRVSALSQVRAWLLKEGSEFHSRARAFLSKFDNDLNYKAEVAGVTVSLTTFSLAPFNEK